MGIGKSLKGCCKLLAKTATVMAGTILSDLITAIIANFHIEKKMRIALIRKDFRNTGLWSTSLLHLIGIAARNSVETGKPKITDLIGFKPQVVRA